MMGLAGFVVVGAAAGDIYAVAWTAGLCGLAGGAVLSLLVRTLYARWTAASSVKCWDCGTVYVLGSDGKFRLKDQTS